jgi:uncharacterized protein (DUF1778 family)
VSRPNRAEAPSKQTCTRLSPAERDRVDEAAAMNHQTVSEFARDALITATDDCLDAPKIP